MFSIHQLKYKNILSIDQLSIPADTITCIIGESGSGKTTLLKMLNHLISPDSGEIKVNGTSIFDLNPVDLRRKVVMLPQTPAMFKGTVRDNLFIALRFAGRPNVPDSELDKLLARVHLNKDLDTDSESLSGGERQRVGLARVLLLDPPVLLLDEPSSALDEETTHLIMEELTDYVHENKKTLVMVTHSKAVVSDYAEHIIEIRSGHVVRESERVEQ
ncbi:ATP-binding cassette domain-containing protein [Sporolactobacillus sp. THM7-4]|nr:ATP-binding cassette domain-containing protein [Sporolactobacillus sp. THM7-4]